MGRTYRLALIIPLVAAAILLGVEPASGQVSGLELLSKKSSDKGCEPLFDCGIIVFSRK